MSTRAAIYVRISRDRHGESLGVQRQEEDCRALADRLGWTVTEVYTDNDRSAYSGKPRPEYERMLADLDCGHINAVLAYSDDRLRRRLAELEPFMNLCNRRGVRVALVRGGDIDYESADGRMVAEIKGSVAQAESRKMAERIRRRQQQDAEHGRPHHGARRYGFEADGVTVREAEAKVIREMSERVLRGDSIRGMVQDLNASGTPAPRGERWTARALSRILIRPRNAGLVERHGAVVERQGVPVTATWDAIVSEATWRAVTAILTDPARNKRKPGPNPVMLLTGIAYCGVCADGTRLRSWTYWSHKRKSPGYRCAVSGHVVRKGEPLDAEVRYLVARLLERPEALGVLAPDTTADRERLTTEIRELHRQRVALMDLLGTFTVAQIREKAEHLDQQIRGLEQELTDLSGETAVSSLLTAPDPAAAFLQAPTHRQREVIPALLSIRIDRAHPGSRSFDFSTVLIAPAGTPPDADRWRALA